MVITGHAYTEDFEYWDIFGFKDNIVDIYYSKDFEKKYGVHRVSRY